MHTKKEILEISNEFEIECKLYKQKYAKFYRVIRIKNGQKSIAKISRKIIKLFTREEMLDLTHQVYNLSRFNHPTILKFEGYTNIDFKNKNNSVILMENASDFRLKDILYFENKKSYLRRYSHFSGGKNDDNRENLYFLLNDDYTKKLIIIYGIASGMSYMHSFNILHRFLKPSNILLDDLLHPKITGFDFSKEIFQRSIKEMKLKGNIRYMAPEILSELEYGKPSDVYSFAFLMYEILTSQKPFDDIKSKIEIIMNITLFKTRPKFKSEIPLCFKSLIEKCWEQDPKKRPTFDEIVFELKNNPKFITDKTNKNEYYDYIKFIDNYPKTFEPVKNIIQIDEELQSKTHTFSKSIVDSNLEKMPDSYPYVDKNKYSYIKNVAIEKESEFYYSYKECSQEITKFYRHEIINFVREVSIISKLNHPAILKFIGYSPIDKDNKPKPMFLTELVYENKMQIYIELNESEGRYIDIDDTKKLIIFYGIASGMSYLHSHDILHRDLKLSNIVFNEYYLPKITGFGISKEICSHFSEEDDKIKGTPAYLAPEVYLYKEYSKASDVYSFSLIMYELLTGEKPYSTLLSPEEIKNEVAFNCSRPPFNKPISKCYRTLIEKCWSQNPKDRPTFDEILIELKTNPDFIIDTIDQEDFIEYIEYINEFPVSFEKSIKIQQLEDIITSKLHTFKDCKTPIYLKSMYETEMNDISFSIDYFNITYFRDDLNNFNGSFYHVGVCKNLSTNYIKKVSHRTSKSWYKHELINLSRELNIILKLNYPSIIECIGFVVNKFNKLIIITEYASHGTLEMYFEYHRANNLKNIGIDRFYLYDEINLSYYKKLIILYGIASGMSYLHSFDILHRDLKPKNIYIDEYNFPKISGFSISKEIGSHFSEEDDKIKGTPAYLAPEVYLYKEYSKASDVYSFSLIMYELLTGEKPYSTLLSPEEIKNEVAFNCSRPPFNKPISKCYRTLIEKCWSQNPKDRPTFDEILIELKTNPDFIIDTIDQEDFIEYIEYIEFLDESSIILETSKQIQQLDEYVKSKLHKFPEFPKSKFNLRNIYETETNNILLDCNYIDLKKYEIVNFVYNSENFKIQKIRNKETGKFYLAKIITDIEDIKRYRFVELSNELTNISSLNHPSFLKFIGYSPIDFKNRPRPVYLSEYAENGILGQIFEMKKSDLMIDDTKKIIIIFGIAAGMSYLHSQDIIHGNLNPSNIFLDEFLFPKITGLDNSRNLSENPIIAQNYLVENGTFYGDYHIFCSPELIKYNIYSAAGDVYSFAMIVYHLIMDDLSFLTDQLDNFFENYTLGKFTPKFNKTTPECYKKLIIECFSDDPQSRPSFEEIIFHLKNNPEFITEKVNKEEFFSYVNYIECSVKNIENKNTIIQIDDFLKTQNQTFRKVTIDYQKLKNINNIPFSVNIGSVDLNNYEKNEKIGEGNFGKVYKIVEKNTGKIYAAKIYRNEISYSSDTQILDLIREVNIISSLNHPAILKFVGFNQYNFKEIEKPVIITEFSLLGSLKKILNNNKCEHILNGTKKLIILYGIANGMSYLHNKNIIHRDLKPDNILLDEFLYPRIADFGLSKDISDESKYEKQKSKELKREYKAKGTFKYCAPEIFNKNEYSTKSDVYAFGLMAYEIITNEDIFKGVGMYQLLYEITVKKSRPRFNKPIPYCYRKLIEKCWNDKEYYRPDFLKIVEQLEKDPSFLTPDVDKKEYYDYVYLIKEQQASLLVDLSNNNPDRTKQLNNKISIDIDQKDTPNKLHKCFIDLSKFTRKSIKRKYDFSKIIDIKENDTNQFYSAQVSMIKIRPLSDEEIINLSKKIEIISQINHPSILTFIGFSPVDFKKDKKPVIVTEQIGKNTLEDILENERMNKKIPGWNDTKKLICMFGIASAMSYMHSLNIVHCCLQPSHIFLDDILFPKIGDFGLSTKFFDIDSMTQQTISGKNATPIYSAPEVLKSNEYTKASDVYSYSIIIYEIITNQIPFNEISSINQICEAIVIKNQRPVIGDKVPSSYRNLIKKCWSQNPNERPTFDDIVISLKTDLRFITKDVSHEDYHKYIDIIESKIKYIKEKFIYIKNINKTFYEGLDLNDFQ